MDVNEVNYKGLADFKIIFNLLNFSPIEINKKINIFNKKAKINIGKVAEF